MQNILTIPLCQGTFLRSKNHERINNSVSHATIELISHDNYEPTMSSLEEISVVKAKEALTKNLFVPKESMQVFSNLEAVKEAIKIFLKRNNTKSPANITETLKFHQVKSESLELSVSAREIFARIGARARKVAAL